MTLSLGPLTSCSLGFDNYHSESKLRSQVSLRGGRDQHRWSELSPKLSPLTQVSHIQHHLTGDQIPVALSDLILKSCQIGTEHSTFRSWERLEKALQLWFESWKSRCCNPSEMLVWLNFNSSVDMFYHNNSPRTASCCFLNMTEWLKWLLWLNGSPHPCKYFLFFINWWKKEFYFSLLQKLRSCKKKKKARLQSGVWKGCFAWLSLLGEKKEKSHSDVWLDILCSLKSLFLLFIIYHFFNLGGNMRYCPMLMCDVTCWFLFPVFFRSICIGFITTFFKFFFF